jgi:toluene monooxygenase system protein E
VESQPTPTSQFLQFCGESWGHRGSVYAVAVVDCILEEIEVSGYGGRLSPRWVHILSAVIAPLRYLGHGLQMLASYIGQIAPSGRIVIPAPLQAGEEMRRVQ